MDSESSKAAALAAAALEKARAGALWIWRHDWALLVAVTLMNLFFARRTFGDGIWADNDSVCHYAYLRHLVEDFYPATGTFMGFSPRYNLGIPYLVYNTPPGVYVLSALVGKLTGLSPLASLKTVAVGCFLSIPLLGFSMARTFDEERTDLPKFTALTLSLFSSELFGLEFYFKNGMLNPALAVPMLMAALIAFRRAQLTKAPRALGWIALGGAMFALTVFTHVLSAYMLCLSLLAFTVGRGLGELGASVFKLGLLLTVGGLLVAEWLVPSLAFAAPTDAAYTWSRDWGNTLADFFDGSLFSSYPVGFFPSFITRSNVAIMATIAGLWALVQLVRKYNHGVGSAAIGFALAMTIVLGPTLHFGVSILPLYEKLLWYRFVTLAALMWFMVAAYGAYRFADSKFKWYPLNVVLLAGLGLWAFFVMTTRAVRVSTAESQPQFAQSTDDVARWLREHGDRRGRVFSEFLGQGVVQAISVNYPRHMIPILSGFDEAGGWIYENNPASQGLMKKGPFWFNPIPMIEEAPHYNVKYVVAGSPQFIHALANDPRWRTALETPDLVLFERVGYEPSFSDAPGVSTKVSRAEYVRGGGYLYELELVTPSTLSAPTTLLVKTNYAPSWTATLGGAPLATRSTDDGMLLVDLPAGTPTGALLRLEWSIAELRAKGHKGTLLGLALLFALVAASRLRRWPLEFVPSRVIHFVGSAAFVLALAGFAWRSRTKDLSKVGGFGIAGGMSTTLAADSLAVGAFYDEQSTLPVHVLPAAWSPRRVSAKGEAERGLLGDGPAAVVTLSPGVTLAIDGSSPAADLTLSLGEEGGAVACTLHATLGAPVVVPDACLGAKVEGSLGYRRELRIAGASPLAISRIRVGGGVRYLEAEGLINTVYDGGCEAFYSAGSAVEYYPQNGALMTADPAYHCPIELLGEVAFAPGDYDVFALARTLHPRFRMTRADVLLDVDGVSLPAFDGVSRTPIKFWDRDTRYEWVRLGRAKLGARSSLTLHVQRRMNAVAALADIDTLAFEPR